MFSRPLSARPRRPLPASSRLALPLLTGLLLAGCATTPAPVSPASKLPAPSVSTPAGGGLGEQSLTPWLCGDVQDQYVLAHEDDDLLFMNPDLHAAIRAGHCTLSVYLTAGEDNKQGAAGLTYMKQREEGVRQAYAKMAGQPNRWTEGVFSVNGKRVKTFILAGDQRVVMMFLRLPDGAESDYTKTLAALNSSGDPAFTLAAIDGSNTYTKAQLVKTLADIMKYAQPKYVHLQDSSPEPYVQDNNVPVGDHVDHIVGARLTEAAEQQYTQPHMRVRYRDYNINTETQPNLSAADQLSKLNTFNVYAANDVVICPQQTPCVVPGEVSLYSYFGWTQRQYFHLDENQQGTVLSRPDGTLQAFVTGTRSSSLRVIGRPASGVWGAWQDLKGNFSALPVVSPYSDGRLAAFVHSNYGTLFYAAQNDDQSWGAWRELGGQGVSDAAVSLDGAGKLRVVAASNGGALHEMTDSSSRGAWSTWRSVGNSFYAASNPALGLGANGRLSLLALDSRGALRVTAQTADGSWNRTWQSLGGTLASAPVTARTPDGRLEVFVRGQDSGLYHAYQSAAGGWSALETLGHLSFSGQPVVSVVGGLLTVAVRGTQGQVSVLQQQNTAPGSAWTEGQDLGAPPTFFGSTVLAVIGLAATPDGSMEVVVRADDGNIYHGLKSGATFGGWSSLGN